MTALMTKRERCLRTVRFEETDRVPVYDILQNDAIIEHYARRPLTYENGARTVAVACGAALDMTRMVGGPQEPCEFVRDDGIQVRQERWTSWLIERPFRTDHEMVAWVEARVLEAEASNFSRDDAERFFQRIEERWADFAEGDPTGRNDSAVYVIESGVGLTEMYWALGMGHFTTLMLEHPDLLEAWLDARHRAELRRVQRIADAEYIPIALTYDDIAHKTGTLFSPDWLRTLWVPRLKRLISAWRERGVYCLFHSDGNLWGVLDDLVAAGIDGLNPLETLASMDVAEVRRRYPKLFLAGGIDVSQLLTYANPYEIEAECRRCIKATGGRGLFIGSTTELHWDVPLDNARAMFDSVQSTTTNSEG